MTRTEAQAILDAGGRVRRSSWNHWVYLFIKKGVVHLRGLVEVRPYDVPDFRDATATDWEEYKP